MVGQARGQQWLLLKVVGQVKMEDDHFGAEDLRRSMEARGCTGDVLAGLAGLKRVQWNSRAVVEAESYLRSPSLSL